MLDVGCGPVDSGYPFDGIQQEVISLDTSADSLRTCGYRENIHPILGDALHLPLRDGCIATAVATEVLEHVPSDGKMVAEISRVVKPDGQLVITVPHDGIFSILDPNHFYPARAVLKIIGRRAQLIHRHYSLGRLVAVLGDDFEVERVSRTGCLATAICVLLVQFSKLTRNRKLEEMFNLIGAYDYQLEYGRVAYNLAISARKTS